VLANEATLAMDGFDEPSALELDKRLPSRPPRHAILRRQSRFARQQVTRPQLLLLDLHPQVSRNAPVLQMRIRRVVAGLIRQGDDAPSAGQSLDQPIPFKVG
jgi:hypothetical protein